MPTDMYVRLTLYVKPQQKEQERRVESVGKDKDDTEI